MCGIIAYITCHSSPIRKVLKILLNGLFHMEYRGYDSAGICFDYNCENENKISVIRSVGFISDLQLKINDWASTVNYNEMISNQTALGHTRWATHGVPSEKNCHPMLSDVGADFRVVHNGIITNFNKIKNSLVEAGYLFTSETDTEVVAVLLKDIYDSNQTGFVDLCLLLLEKIEGSFALAITSSHFPGECIGIRYKSPLIVGIKSDRDLAGERLRVLKNHGSSEKSFFSENTEFFLTSDPCAIVEETRNIIYLANGDLVHVDRGRLSIFNFGDNPVETREVCHCPFDVEQIQKGKYRYFMEKEIYEQPDRVRDTLRGRVSCENAGTDEGSFIGDVCIPGIEEHFVGAEKDQRIVIFGCGTSFYSGLAVKPLMEEMTQCAVTVVTACEFLDLPTCLYPERDIYVFVSQSGETADLLSALALVKQKCERNKTLCLTNNIGSTLARECSVVLDIRAGPELGVASTKAYACQAVLLVLLSLNLSKIFHGEGFRAARRREIIQGLFRLPDDINHVLSMHDEIRETARGHLETSSLMLVGRGYGYAACYESSLKIKELSYIHSSAINAGELKHGPLALVDEKAAIIFFLFNDHIYEKSCNALQQIIARKGKPVVISCGRLEEALEAHSSHRVDIPRNVDCLQFVTSVVAMQIFAMESAHLRGYNVDRPRNLAKSVTVE